MSFPTCSFLETLNYSFCMLCQVQGTLASSSLQKQKKQSCPTFTETQASGETDPAPQYGAGSLPTFLL
jgi:hypothetical protein